MLCSDDIQRGIGMKITLETRDATCAESPGMFNDNATLLLKISRADRSTVKRVTTAIVAALQVKK